MHLAATAGRGSADCTRKVKAVRTDAIRLCVCRPQAGEACKMYIAACSSPGLIQQNRIIVYLADADVCAIK